MTHSDCYPLAIETDRRLIRGESIFQQEREAVAAALLESSRTTAAGERKAGRKWNLYPIFYVPEPGIKLHSLFGQTPKTKILAGNMYELEILRILCLFAPENEQVRFMRDETLQRLKSTCFGWQDDGVGECFDASLVTLRFLCAAAPNELEWIQSRVDNYRRHAGKKKRAWYSLWYFWLCLSEMPWEIAEPELEKDRQELERQLRRSYVMNREPDRTVHPVLACMLRNLMSRLPEYGWLKERGTYIGEKDGRLRLDMEQKDSIMGE